MSHGQKIKDNKKKKFTCDQLSQQKLIFRHLLSGFPGGSVVKNLPANEDPLEKEMQPTPVFLPGKPLGQRGLAGYHPWGCKELDTTEHALSDAVTQCSVIRLVVGRLMVIAGVY